jgi:hypothetical protein
VRVEQFEAAALAALLTPQDFNEELPETLATLDVLDKPAVALLEGACEQLV